MKKVDTLQQLNIAMRNLDPRKLTEVKVLCINDGRSWSDLCNFWNTLNNACDATIYTSGVGSEFMDSADVDDYDVIILSAANAQHALTVLGQNSLYDKLLQYNGVIIGLDGFADVLSRNEHDGLAIVPATVQFVELGAHTDDVSCFNVEDTEWYVGVDQVVTYNGTMLQVETVLPL